MKAKVKKFFSLSVTDTEYYKDMKEKFELVSCPIDEKHCKELRSELNKLYFDAEQFQIDKKYQKSVDLLKIAYQRTFELTKPTCANCANFFRSTMEESILNVQSEQHRLSRGLFRLKRYQLDSLELDPVLKKA